MNMMTTITALAVREVENEPRVLDTDLGTALGMARPTNIRTLIKEHMEALIAFGNVAFTACDVAMPNGGTKLGTAFWLNEEQATYVTMHLRTPEAQAVRAFNACPFASAYHP